MHAAFALAPGLTAAALLSTCLLYHGSCLAGPHTEFVLVLCYYEAVRVCSLFYHFHH